MQDSASEYQVFDLPDDAFKQSGTNVHTSVLYFVKREKVVERREPQKEDPSVEEKPLTPAVTPAGSTGAGVNVPAFGSILSQPSKRKKATDTAFTQGALF
jgi:hypothetical protein